MQPLATCIGSAWKDQVEAPNSFVSTRQLYTVLRLTIPKSPRSASLRLWYETGSGESLRQFRIDSSVCTKVENFAGRPLFVQILSSPPQVEAHSSLENFDFDKISEPGDIERRLLAGRHGVDDSDSDDEDVSGQRWRSSGQRQGIDHG
jgi:hypothetical protein